MESGGRDWTNIGMVATTGLGLLFSDRAEPWIGDNEQYLVVRGGEEGCVILN